MKKDDWFLVILYAALFASNLMVYLTIIIPSYNTQAAVCIDINQYGEGLLENLIGYFLVMCSFYGFFVLTKKLTENYKYRKMQK